MKLKRFNNINESVEIDKSQSIVDNFIINRFGGTETDYAKEWYKRFEKGVDVAWGQMDTTSRGVFIEVLQAMMKA